MKFAGLSFLVAIAMSLVAVAQDGQEPAFRSESNVVIVPTLVRDRDRNIVYGLTAQDFIIKDDGVPQKVHLDESATTKPSSIVVVLQLGRRADYELPRIQGLSSMLTPLLDGQHANVALVTFASRVHQIQGFSTDSSTIARNLSALEAGDGGAAIVDAVDHGVKLLQTTPNDHQRVLLLVSETRDHGSKKRATDILRELGNSNIVVYALTFSPSKSNVLDTMRGTNNPDFHPEQTETHEGPDLLAPLILTAQAMRKNAAKVITSMTGGEYAQFASGKAFDRDMTEFSNHLYARYLLSFAASKPHPGLHHLVVRLAAPGRSSVLARESYWAAAPDSAEPAQLFPQPN